MTRATRLTAGLLGPVCVVALSACGSSAGAGGSAGAGPDSPAGRQSSTSSAHPAAGAVSGPCDVTDRSTVASVFAGVGAGKAGPARNCGYSLASGPIDTVNVYYFGTSADWNVQKSQAKANVGPLRELAIGDSAYYAPRGGASLTVRKGGIIFAVQILGRGFPSASFQTAHLPQLETLARKVAAQH